MGCEPAVIQASRYFTLFHGIQVAVGGYRAHKLLETLQARENFEQVAATRLPRQSPTQEKRPGTNLVHLMPTPRLSASDIKHTKQALGIASEVD